MKINIIDALASMKLISERKRKVTKYEVNRMKDHDLPKEDGKGKLIDILV